MFMKKNDETEAATERLFGEYNYGSWEIGGTKSHKKVKWFTI
jgi:hypothetical protein